MPRIFVAFRLAAGISLIVAVTVEIAVNPLGLGYGVMTAGQALRPELMLAYLFWIGIVGYAPQRCAGVRARPPVRPRGAVGGAAMTALFWRLAGLAVVAAFDRGMERDRGS